MSIITIVFLILAVLAFILAFANAPRFNWVALGLIFCVLGFLLPAIV